MSVLRVQLLGSVSLSNRGSRRLELATSCRALLGYLCANGHRTVPRQEVVGALWAELDEPRARRCLSTALWRLKATPGLGPELARNKGPDEIGLSASRTLWIDTVAFQRRVLPWQGVATEDLDARARHQLARAIAIYGGEFLPQVDDEWALLERQRLHALYLDALYQLTAAYAGAKDYARAIAFGRRLAAVEPLREDVHRILMLAYVATGNRGKAIEQYRVCQGELGTELGIKPMAETQALFREIVEPDGARLPAPSARLAASLAAADEQVRWVRRALRRADERLAEAQAMIERAGSTAPNR
jgi:DNA-binding SARP family transcriptional activator